MYDTHVHTTFSADGKSIMADYMELPDNGKLKGIGFAEHLDFMPECGSYRYLDYRSYIETINKFKEKGYDLHAGAEVDYSSALLHDILQQLQETPFEYTICSVHMIDGQSLSDGTNLERLKDPAFFRAILEKYYKEVESSLKVREFDVIGHINIYKRHLTDVYYADHALRSWIAEAEDELARACALSGKIVEVNSSGLFSVSGSPCPENSFLKSYRSYGGSLVSLGSDAHSSIHAGRGFDRIKAMLSQLKFTHLVYPWNTAGNVRL